ncbi:MAG TPA: MFS transporter [Gemmatimonadales bacterium]|nr:MFS transporter [Gemmatimonadales bacterium]
MTTPSPKVPRAVYLFGATSLVNDFASEMIYPLLPAFVTRMLGGGALALGVLDGVAEAVAAGFKLVSGYLGERPRLRGPLVVGGYAIAAAVRPLIATAGAAWHVIALRGTDRVGKGIRTAPRDMIIADVAPEEIRGRAFGLQRAADHVGAIFGPLTAAALIYRGVGIRSVFWVAAVPGLAAVLIAWIAVREAGVRDQGLGMREGEAPNPYTLTPNPSSSSFAALTAVLVLAASLRAPETLLILRAQDLGVPVALVPILWAALHVVRSSTSYPGGALADRWGPRRTLAVGWLIYAGLAVAFAVATTAALAWAIFLAFGMFVGLTESPERKLVAELAPGGRRGRGFGWYHGSLSAVALPGAALFGWIYQNRGAAPALEASAVVTVLAVLALPLSSSASGPRPRSAG